MVNKGTKEGKGGHLLLHIETHHNKGVDRRTWRTNTPRNSSRTYQLSTCRRDLVPHTIAMLSPNGRGGGGGGEEGLEKKKRA